jgi:ferric-dicitrate binding protein FerR (iron transport regulator)
MTRENREKDDSQLENRAERIIETIMYDNTPHELRAHLVEWFASAENEREKMQALEAYMHRTLTPDPVPDEFTKRMFDEFMLERAMYERAADVPAPGVKNIVPLRRRKWFSFFVGAASTAAVLAIGYGVMSRYSDWSVPHEADVASVVPEIPVMIAEAPEGGSREVVLPDSTKVRLNSGGKLSWPQQFAADERRVRLEGEARFDVRKDGRSRFLVETNTMKIRVFGTIFDVHDNAAEKINTVTLHEGSIEVNIGENVRKLVPGERLVHRHGTDEIAVAIVENVWAAEVVAEMKTLPEIMDMLSDFYGVSISFDRATLPAGEYSISFSKDDPPDKVLSVLSLISGGFRFEKQPNGTIIIL